MKGGEEVDVRPAREVAPEKSTGSWEPVSAKEQNQGGSRSEASVGTEDRRPVRHNSAARSQKRNRRSMSWRAQAEDDKNCDVKIVMRHCCEIILFHSKGNKYGSSAEIRKSWIRLASL